MRIPTPTRPLRFGEFVALLALMFSTIAFSVDAMLPALPVMAAELSPEAPNLLQLVVTVFVLGMGLGTLIAGPISDALGRKSVVAVGIAIYCGAALVAARAQTLEVLLAARFVQGLGASAPRVVTLAMVRDLYQGRMMARVMSFVMTLFVLVPAVAPAIGAGIIAVSGWRAVFLAFVVFGIVAASWMLLRQPETHPPEKRRPLRADTLRAALREVLGSRLVVTYIAALSLGFGQMFVHLSTTPQIFAELFDRQESFPFWFAGIALAAGTSGLLNATLVMKYGMRRLATTAFAAQTALSLLMLAMVLAGPPAPWDFALYFVYMCTAFFMVGLTFGNLNALALEPLGHIAGLAASVVGSVSTVLAVVIAIPIAQLYDGSLVPVVTGVMLCAALACALMLTTRRAASATGAV